MTQVFLAVLATIVPLHNCDFLFHVGDLSVGSVAEVIQALDTDHSGSVEETEIEAYAQKRGLDAAETRKEFQVLDKNGDGVLEADEVGNTLGVAAEAAKLAVNITQISPIVLSTAAQPPAEQSPLAGGKPLDRMALVIPEVALATATKSEGSALLDASSLLLEVREQSGRALAEVFSRQAEEVLASRAQNVEAAAKLDELARSLRQNISELVSSAPQAVADSTLRVVNDETQQSFADANLLQQRALKAEQEASEARAESFAATERAKSAQGTIMAAVQQLRARGA